MHKIYPNKESKQALNLLLTSKINLSYALH